MKNLITCLVVGLLSGATFATTWTVDDDGKADFDNIQDAVDAASDGDEIIVAPGTYTSTAKDEIVLMHGKEVWLHSSAGAEVTIIDGEGTRRGIHCSNGETSNTIIEGFTITNGYTTGNGGGMYNENGSSPTLINCKFENNTANYYGGGMHNSGGSPTLDGCTFTGNTGGTGGGMYSSSSEPTLTNCTFTNNSAYNGGGGMYNYYGSATLTNCTFENNVSISSGGGALFYNTSEYLTDCTFTNNTATAGGGLYCINDNGSSAMTGCVFNGNVANFPIGDNDGGGGLLCTGEVQITNCTFEGNISNSVGGGACVKYDENHVFTNCIFLNNTASSYGGGVMSLSGWSYISACTFSNNSSVSGGALFADASGDGTAFVSESLICENSHPQLAGNWIDKGGNQVSDLCSLGGCCTGNQASCVMSTQLDCEYFGGNFQGYSVECIDVSCPTSCLGDVTGDGQVNVSDLLVVISVWGACP